MVSAGDPRLEGRLGWQPTNQCPTSLLGVLFVRWSPGPLARVCLCVVWHPLFGDMDAALFVSDSSKSQLDSGVAAKLRSAAESMGPMVLPTSTSSVVGLQWRRLAREADLQELELETLRDWIEDVHGIEPADRFSLPLSAVAVTVKTVPVKAAPDVVASPPRPPAAEAGSAERTFAQMMSGVPAQTPDWAAWNANSVPLPLAMVSETEREDVQAHGFEAGMIAILTWFLHTARPPPPEKSLDQLQYGVDPSSVRKLYAGMQSSVGTLLWELVKSCSSTMKDFQNHFYRAVQAASGYPAIKQRISSHWIEMTQYFDTVEMVRAYYRKFLTIRSGRGLPKLIDEHILMLVMCTELENAREGSSGASGSAEMQMLISSVEKQSRAAEATKELITELKTKVGEVKGELNNLKADYKTLKEKVSTLKAGGKDTRICGYCNQPGHTEHFCHTRIKDEATKEAKKNAAV